MKAQELEDRLVDFAVLVIGVVEALLSSKAGSHIGAQMIRSGTSPAPNYGEARSAESRKDFIHKMKISLIELRETMIWLKIIARKRLLIVHWFLQSLRSVMNCSQFLSRAQKPQIYQMRKIKNQQLTIVNRQLLPAERRIAAFDAPICGVRPCFFRRIMPENCIEKKVCAAALGRLSFLQTKPSWEKRSMED